MVVEFVTHLAPFPITERLSYPQVRPIKAVASIPQGDNASVHDATETVEDAVGELDSRFLVS